MNYTKEILNLIDIESMDDILYYLYLRDIVGEAVDSAKLRTLKEKILKSEWVQKVVSQQWEDGSWGRFHSLSTSTDSEFTTESALRRLIFLGLDKSDPPIKKALSYMESYLRGEIELRNRAEKMHDWGGCLLPHGSA